MTNVEILNTILSIPGASMARQNKTNFVVVPSEDGYVKIAVSNALAKDTKAHKAFNAEAAIAEYKAIGISSTDLFPLPHSRNRTMPKKHFIILFVFTRVQNIG